MHVSTIALAYFAVFPAVCTVAGEHALHPQSDTKDDVMYDIMDGPNPCRKYKTSMLDNHENRERCLAYENLDFIIPDCEGKEELVPKIYHSVGKTDTQSYVQLATSLANPDYARNHLGDSEAKEYIKFKCGVEAAETYACLAAPAYRGDLFRFCALYAEGGVYLDGDITPLAPL